MLLHRTHFEHHELQSQSILSCAAPCHLWVRHGLADRNHRIPSCMHVSLNRLQPVNIQFIWNQRLFQNRQPRLLITVWLLPQLKSTICTPSIGVTWPSLAFSMYRTIRLGDVSKWNVILFELMKYLPSVLWPSWPYSGKPNVCRFPLISKIQENSAPHPTLMIGGPRYLMRVGFVIVGVVLPTPHWPLLLSPQA